MYTFESVLYGSIEKFKAIVLCHLAEKWKVRQIEHNRGPLVDWYYKWQSLMEKLVIPSLLPPEITRLHMAHFRIRALSDQLVPGTGQSRLSIWKQIKFHNCERLNQTKEKLSNLSLPKLDVVCEQVHSENVWVTVWVENVAVGTWQFYLIQTSMDGLRITSVGRPLSHLRTLFEGTDLNITRGPVWRSYSGL